MPLYTKTTATTPSLVLISLWEHVSFGYVCIYEPFVLVAESDREPSSFVSVEAIVDNSLGRFQQFCLLSSPTLLLAAFSFFPSCRLYHGLLLLGIGCQETGFTPYCMLTKGRGYNQQDERSGRPERLPIMWMLGRVIDEEEWRHWGWGWLNGRRGAGRDTLTHWIPFFDSQSPSNQAWMRCVSSLSTHRVLPLMCRGDLRSCVFILHLSGVRVVIMVFASANHMTPDLDQAQ